MKAIIPAAGKGSRLHSPNNDLPKVMQRICDRPLLEIVLEQIDFIPDEDKAIVVGYKQEVIRSYFGNKYNYVEQKEQLGTGHAIMVCKDLITDYDGTVLILFGDMPLFRREIMKAMCEEHERLGNKCTLMTAKNEELQYWARIVRDKDGLFSAIVESADCTEEQKGIEELFAGVLAFDSKALFEVLPQIGTNNKQHEYYLTEVPELMARLGMKVGTFMTDNKDDLRGVNTFEDMVICEQIMKRRLADSVQ